MIVAGKTDLIERLGGPPTRAEAPPAFLIVEAGSDGSRIGAYRSMRKAEFVDRQDLFARSDVDHHDDSATTRVLVGLDRSGDVIGGVRLHPAAGLEPELGWWMGSRLVARACDGATRGEVGAALVRAACATAQQSGVIRFDAHVQSVQRGFFRAIGWSTVSELSLHGVPHVLMRWPIRRFEELAEATKAPIGELLGGLRPGGEGWVGDDGTPVPGSQTVVSTDSISPAMVQRDPWWAGWCGMLVTANDLAAMGASRIGALDGLAHGTAASAKRVMEGLKAGSEAFGLPILGGHTQLGVPAALNLTGIGRASRPVPAGGAQPGDALSLAIDLGGSWRPGYKGRQWDSSSGRDREQISRMLGAVAGARPKAAKDVSMAGIVGTAGMMAEASNCGVVIDLDRIPRPSSVGVSDWLSCFPGFGMLSASRSGSALLDAGPARSEECGVFESDPGVRLRWPDGQLTDALGPRVTGLGPASGEAADE